MSETAVAVIFFVCWVGTAVAVRKGRGSWVSSIGGGFVLAAIVLAAVGVMSEVATYASEANAAPTVPSASTPHQSQTWSAIGAAPFGDPVDVAAHMLKLSPFNCSQVAAATRLSDGTVSAQCADGRRFRVLAISGRPVAFDCSAVDDKGRPWC